MLLLLRILTALMRSVYWYLWRYQDRCWYCFRSISFSELQQNMGHKLIKLLYKRVKFHHHPRKKIADSACESVCHSCLCPLVDGCSPRVCGSGSQVVESIVRKPRSSSLHSHSRNIKKYRWQLTSIFLRLRIFNKVIKLFRQICTSLIWVIQTSALLVKVLAQYITVVTACQCYIKLLPTWTKSLLMLTLTLMRPFDLDMESILKTGSDITLPSSISYVLSFC